GLAVDRGGPAVPGDRDLDVSGPEHRVFHGQPPLLRGNRQDRGELPEEGSGMSSTNRTRPDDIGGYLLGAIVTLACGVPPPSGGWGACGGPCRLRRGGPAARPRSVPAPDPIARAEAGLSPDSTNADPGKPDPEIHTIQVFPAVVYMTTGGQITRHVDLEKPAA